MINKNTLVLIFFAIFIACPNKVLAQDKVFNGNPDTTFKTARELAFDGKRKQAQDSLKLILTKYPNYLDIRAFLASTYSWDGNYKEARKEFQYVLEKDEKRKTDWIAYIKNEQYAEKYFKALELSNKSLVIFPDDPDLVIL
jgi:tetratricopeptide (TPR) repeat protein